MRLPALALIAALALVACSRNESGSAVDGVVITFNDDYFFPADGSAPRLVIPTAASQGLSDTCIAADIRLTTQRQLAPVDLEHLDSDDAYIDAPAIEILRVRSHRDLGDRCDAPRLARFKGVFTTAAIETSLFWPEGNNEVWWVHDTRGLKIAFGPPIEPESKTIPEQHSCIDVLAVVSPPAPSGHLGMASRGMRIFKVLWSSPHAARSSEGCAFPR